MAAADALGRSQSSKLAFPRALPSISPYGNPFPRPPNVPESCLSPLSSQAKDVLLRDWYRSSGRGQTEFVRISQSPSQGKGSVPVGSFGEHARLQG